ncbi:hypothetical protein [Mucilaginibacter arboris]|uniref:Uncharacterized protein n=1 Tax=Mucilaginibacter arboris TaxID=2682090 RepID=A0A7K1SVB9_9SPHI|nr:hypothetical protein [Mucilaginibacter arboris]MVN21292.1 hypothetical protein [Mucilaginibacter arboris]
MFKKRSLVSKLWLKYKDRNLYKQYKWEQSNYTEQEVLNFFTGSDRLDTQEKIIAVAKEDKQLNIIHSGNAGDIIYALPTIKKIFELTGVPINFYLRLNQPLIMSGYNSHPMGNVRLNQSMAAMLYPILNLQNYLHKCETYQNQKIHIDLDFFRSKIISQTNSNLARWYSYVTGITPELWKSWLNTESDFSYADKIILARSERYCNSTIDYSFLKNYNNVLFVGVKSEYETMKKIVPNLQWIQVKDFLELTRIIAGCKFFIGNQSFPYSIAEGLKVPRILEAYYHISNVIPEGKNAYDFYFQNHFESLVNQLSK